MRNGLRGFIPAIAAAGVAALGAATTLPVAGQTAAYRAPRTPDGKPDLNGIWQSLNEANFDLETHMARPAMQLRAGPYGPVPAAPVLALGAVGAVPPGMGVTDGPIPYKPEALVKKKNNQEHWVEKDPEIKCYLPGVPRATYMPYPFQLLQSQSAIFLAYEYAGAVRNVYLKDRGRRRLIRGWASRSRTGKARHSSSTRQASTKTAGSIARATSTATRSTSSSATRAWRRTSSTTRRRSTIRRCSRNRGRSACRSTVVSTRTRSSWTSSASSSSRNCSTASGGRSR